MKGGDEWRVTSDEQEKKQVIVPSSHGKSDEPVTRWTDPLFVSWHLSLITRHSSLFLGVWVA
jgi:hypothetical protein